MEERDIIKAEEEAIAYEIAAEEFLENQIWLASL